MTAINMHSDARNNKNINNGMTAHDTPLENTNEHTALLFLPSPASTDGPSHDRNLLEYGSTYAITDNINDNNNHINTNHDRSSIQMHTHNSNSSLTGLLYADEGAPMDTLENDDDYPKRKLSHLTLRRKSSQSLICLLASLAGLIMVFVVGMHHQHHHGNTNSNGTHSADDTGTTINSITPLSTQDPVADLKVLTLQRPAWSTPNPELFPANEKPKPTNAWYQNLLLASHEPSGDQKVYPSPYVVDVVGPIPGIRLLATTLIAGNTMVQVTHIPEHGLTLGAASPRELQQLGTDTSTTLSKKYTIGSMTPLGITLEWPDNKEDESTSLLTYSSSIVRGMPYGTMKYNFHNSNRDKIDNTISQDVSPFTTLPAAALEEKSLRNRHHLKHDHTNKEESLSTSFSDQSWPTLVSEIGLAKPPILDGNGTLDCDDEFNVQIVAQEIQLTFADSDYTWLVFVSQPVKVVCHIPPPSEEDPAAFVPGVVLPPSSQFAVALQLTPVDLQQDELVVRIAMVNDCTHGRNPVTCLGPKQPSTNATAYAQLLRQQANWYPGDNTNVHFAFDANANSSQLTMDWDVQSMKKTDETDSDNGNLLMFALPHHQDLLEETSNNAQSTSFFPTYAHNDDDDDAATQVCTSSLLGPTCLVQGDQWQLQEPNKWIDFRAPRPPASSSLPALAKAYQQDLEYSLPSYFQRGAGDTYFSGKMLAKLGRILTVGEELYDICEAKDRPAECQGLDIPSLSGELFQKAVGSLRSSVEVWINSTAETPFVYDREWGGLVSCGCNFDSKNGKCWNAFPDCPGFYDPGLNFGNAFYNDHHFHYGYHVYAAAVVAHFDPKWGRDHFDQVLLLIRDFANPSSDDSFFPTFRQKDWYQGSSWASGIAVSPPNGRNQESSSEAIAAYEGVALYGKEMIKAWQDHDEAKAHVALDIQNYGNLLSASELRSADRYWHVIEANSKRRQYPEQYTPHVIGIMWTTMVQFQTWFGNAAYLAYGIQLLPLTSVSEDRDSIEWARELYAPFAESCNAHLEDCRGGGWSVLVLAILATVGHRDEAIEKALDLPESAFTSAGGDGHSLTNTLWYLATRPTPTAPLEMKPEQETEKLQSETKELEKKMHRQGDSTDVNGQPDSGSKYDDKPAKTTTHPELNDLDCGCPETCGSKALNQFASGHTCGDRIAWLITAKDHSEWDACHQVGVEFPEHCSACDPKVCSDKEEVHSKDCPPCSKAICNDAKLNRCPVHQAPFLCTVGASLGGCSRSPWTLEQAICNECCELSIGCGI